MSHRSLDYKLRDAKLGEGEFLSNLALRSKSIWGYEKSFIEACRPHIKIDDEYIVDWPVVLIELESEILGFYSLKVIKSENRLDNLWIEPTHIRCGLGCILFRDAVVRSSQLNWQYFRLAGEPNAISFYEKMGAKLIGEVQSRLKKDLYLPHMEMGL